VVDGVAVIADEAMPVPAMFVAVTVMSYSVPFVRPAITIGLEEPEEVTVWPLTVGVAVTVYPVMALPPFEAGGANETVNWESPIAAATF